MAVSAIAISVIVRNATIQERFPGGMPAFARFCPNRTFCTDGTISRVGFMVESDARTFIDRLRAAGLEISPITVASEIALVEQGHGFLFPCDWLQSGLFDGHPSVWLAGADRGSLFIPRVELNSRIAPIDVNELREHFEFDGLDRSGKVEVYRHKTTGELRYVGRPFHALALRKWWQFWKRPIGDAEGHNRIYRAACDLIQPYVQHQLELPVLDSSARKQLQRGSEMLSRVLQFNPGNWGAWWFMGIAHKCLRELEPAYNDFRRAYALEKSNPDVGRELVGICMALGRGEEAVRISREILEKEPTDAGLVANYALALLIAGNVVEAEAAVETSRKLDPQDEITHHLAKLIAAIRTGRTTRPERWPR
jgi:hypothetical protein